MKRLLLALVCALASSTAVAAPSAPTVKLVSAGKKATAPIRFAPKKGATQSGVMTVTSAISMGAPGKMPPATKVPPVRIVMDVVVSDVKPSGDFRYDVKMHDPEVLADKSTPDAVVQAMKDAMKGLGGLTGYAVLTSRGFVQETKLNIPAGATPQMRQMLEGMQQAMAQIAAPLPEEAVGPGAKWNTTVNTTMNGIVIAQVASYEIREIKGTSVKLKITLAQTGKSAPGAPAVVTLRGKGSGETTYELTAVMPTLGKMKMRSEAGTTLDGKKLVMVNETEMTVTSK